MFIILIKIKKILKYFKKPIKNPKKKKKNLILESLKKFIFNI